MNFGLSLPPRRSNLVRMESCEGVLRDYACCFRPCLSFGRERIGSFCPAGLYEVFLSLPSPFPWRTIPEVSKWNSKAMCAAGPAFGTYIMVFLGTSIFLSQTRASRQRRSGPHQRMRRACWQTVLSQVNTLSLLMREVELDPSFPLEIYDYLLPTSRSLTYTDLCRGV